MQNVVQQIPSVLLFIYNTNIYKHNIIYKYKHKYNN
jgi:hypothetical protein